MNKFAKKRNVLEPETGPVLSIKVERKDFYMYYKNNSMYNIDIQIHRADNGNKSPRSESVLILKYLKDTNKYRENQKY